MASQPNAIASSSKSHHHSNHHHTSQFPKAKQTNHHKEKHATPKHAEGDKDKRKEKLGPFEHRFSRLRLSVAPKFAADWLMGVREILDGLIMRYVPQMRGVLLAHWAHEFADDTVKIVNECPFGVCEVQFRSIVWAPKLGSRLHGTHSLSSPSHLSLLFSRTFNVSIPLQHIPQDLYDFEHTESGEDGHLASSGDEEEANGRVHEVGRWKVKKNGKLLGEDGKGIKFTVIGLQITNQMLSLIGSLLTDPSNPPPPSKPIAPVSHLSLLPSPSPELLDIEPSHKPPHARTKANGPATYDIQIQPLPEVAIQHETIDDHFLSARELKKRRKDEKREKREGRKAKKDEKALEAVEAMDGGSMVGMRGSMSEQELGGKRKAATGREGEMRKKKRDRV